MKRGPTYDKQTRELAKKRRHGLVMLSFTEPGKGTSTVYARRAYNHFLKLVSG